ncbi:hypothetical protein COS59_00545 [Candidatus Wolfebacteria bacterium CG03_land_8_20_14_0_80_36_15]|uniref:Uncharacterized protein n=1 Tax=Candidatus Wolfebacteria bacterium CG03_land_8_20_14_0_80_36_15 TaxID=1975067 RepID=A0A2M7B885_9BACT|nr:MAG: hypothetical protein COS59_00545 [Candidatus Wolfebacteria bacterium CG03_land_8_20_14_0_80_36_15]
MAKKKINKKELSPPERHFGVVLENIDSKLDLVVEGHQALDKKIDTNHQEFKEFRGEVNYKFGVVLDELRLIRNELKEKVGRDEFALLEKRVMALEKSRK